MTESNNNELISIIIPVYNEAGNIAPLLRSIAQSCTGLSYEIIAIDDGSQDSTPKELNEMKKEVSQLNVMTLKKNFGQTAALAAGFDHAKGNILIPLDGDGQNDPQDIPTLVAKNKEGFDVVSGWRKNRKDPFFSRRLPSMLANALISLVTGVHLHDYGCTLKAYNRSVLTGVRIYGEMHRFLPAWCVWQGGTVTEVPVHHHPRIRGKSKYGLFRIFKVIIDLMTIKFFSGYLSKPNYLFSGTGFVVLLMSLVTGMLAIFDKFGPDKFPQYRIPLILVSLFFGLVTIHLILMGLLAELIVRLYFQVSQQKPYRLLNEK